MDLEALKKKNTREEKQENKDETLTKILSSFSEIKEAMVSMKANQMTVTENYMVVKKELESWREKAEDDRRVLLEVTRSYGEILKEIKTGNEEQINKVVKALGEGQERQRKELREIGDNFRRLQQETRDELERIKEQAKPDMKKALKHTMKVAIASIVAALILTIIFSLIINLWLIPKLK